MYGTKHFFWDQNYRHRVAGCQVVICTSKLENFHFASTSNARYLNDVQYFYFFIFFILLWSTFNLQNGLRLIPRPSISPLVLIEIRMRFTFFKSSRTSNVLLPFLRSFLSQTILSMSANLCFRIAFSAKSCQLRESIFGISLHIEVGRHGTISDRWESRYSCI